MKTQIQKIVNDALNKLGMISTEFSIDVPKQISHGDYTTNAAMILGKKLKNNPRELALKVKGEIEGISDIFSKIEIAGPGFINFFIKDEYYKEVINDIILKGNNFGKSVINKNKKANLEWVSANPTGPLHAGHGRQICLGKAIASLLEWSGYEVDREYYYNDAGKQMERLAESVYARYMHLLVNDFPFPDDGYKGDYINEIAECIYRQWGEKYKNNFDKEFFKSEGEKFNFDKIKNTLSKLGINHNLFFNESSLYKSGNIEEIINLLKQKNLVYEKEEALWLRMDENDFEKDKVIVKSTGEPTYRLPDIAYHINKIKRNYDLIVDIFGSDHSDTYKEVLYGVEKAGFNTDNIKVIIHQMVTFKKDNESVKMSKRSDYVYYLDDLINDAGIDAVQFFFVMRAANTHLDFDIALAKEQSDKNPVFYLQYAYARIQGIFRNYETSSINKNYSRNYSLLNTKEELDLIKVLSKFPDEVIDAVDTFEPHRIINYLNSVAETFHKFYHNTRVILPDNPLITGLRIDLCKAVSTVLKNGFDIIGISAPEQM